MSDDVLIRVENVSKKYARRLRHAMWYGMCDLGREIVGRDPRGEQLRTNEFWALKDVSFELKRGECLGIIGPNGAGKSTLLKLLNGIIRPTQGRVRVRGRVGALIEVGAGFHPMLTGRENIYVNGAILGMGKAEIDRKFDEIVAFADIGDFLDTPVKFYSSGMYVRLGFAIAAHLEPDILLIDEVLAVGDVGFRAKCYESISERLQHSAVVLVSHNMPTVSRVCSRLMVMAQGHSNLAMAPEEGIEAYAKLFSGPEARILGSGGAIVSDFSFRTMQDQPTSRCLYSSPLEVVFTLTAEPVHSELVVSLTFTTKEAEVVAQCHSSYSGVTVRNCGGPMRIHVAIPHLLLTPGDYLVNLIVYDLRGVKPLTWHYGKYGLRVDGNFAAGAPVHWKADWRVEETPLVRG